MRTNTFENTGEPIILSREGVLNDGQHRLVALCEADVVVDLDVRFGIARKAFTKTTTGTSRSSSDVLAIRGVTGGTAIAPAVRLLILYRRGLPDSIREFVSNAEVDEGYQRWPGFEAVAKQIAGLGYPRGVRSTPLLTTAFLASRSQGKERLSDWLETLATGVGTGKGDPAYVLRERLMRGVDAAIGTRESLVERFALMVLSWNAYASGATMTGKVLRWSAVGRLAAPFPVLEDSRLQRLCMAGLAIHRPDRRRGAEKSRAGHSPRRPVRSRRRTGPRKTNWPGPPQVAPASKMLRGLHAEVRHDAIPVPQPGKEPGRRVSEDGSRQALQPPMTFRLKPRWLDSPWGTGCLLGAGCPGHPSRCAAVPTHAFGEEVWCHRPMIQVALLAFVPISLALKYHQMALVVAPVLVIASWFIHHSMNLVFAPLDLFAIAATAFIVRAISADGETNWFEGLLLVGVYALMALAFFFVGRT